MTSAPQVDSPAPGAAELLDGWSLLPLAVDVTTDDSGLRITRRDGSLPVLWDRAGLQCDAMQQGVLHVSHASAAHETLVVHEVGLAARILAIAPEPLVLPGGERKLAFALVCLAVILGLGAGIYAATPRIARYVARQIPLEQERALGNQLDLLLNMSACTKPRPAGPLEQLVKRLGGARFEVRVIRGPVPNAFALPGGSIVVTEALLRQARSPEEVAGVLAHEIEHVTQRHVLGGVIRDAALSGIWSITVGDYAGLLVLDPSTAYRFANLEFSRDDEADADAGAVRRLHAVGLPHRGLISFFERLEQRYGKHQGPEWMSTHPSTAARIKKLRSIADIRETRGALTPEQFELLRHSCEAGPSCPAGTRCD